MAVIVHFHARDAREINGDIPRMAREAVAAGKSESQFRAMARAIPLEGRDLEFAMQEFARAMSNKQGSRYSLKDALQVKIGNFWYKYQDGEYFSRPVTPSVGARPGAILNNPWRPLPNPPKDVVAALNKAAGSHDAARLIDTVTDGKATVKVYYDSEWEEYVCRLFVNGAERTAASYHSDDKSDALSTARDMAKRASA